MHRQTLKWEALTIDNSKDHEERREEVKTYRVRSYHVGCGGEWINQGTAYTNTFCTRFLHRCDKCTALADLDRAFPSVEVE